MSWALLCDMDGTLVDSEPYWMASEVYVAGLYGKSWTQEQGLQLTGRTLYRSIEMLRDMAAIPTTVEHLMEQVINYQIHQLNGHVPWMEGAWELLVDAASAGAASALVSSSYRSIVDVAVKSAPKGTLEVVVAGDEVLHGKPDPEPYLKAATMCGVEPSRCVVLEDSPSGVEAGVRAGACVVALGSQFDYSRWPIAAHVGSCADLSAAMLLDLLNSHDGRDAANHLPHDELRR